MPKAHPKLPALVCMILALAWAPPGLTNPDETPFPSSDTFEVSTTFGFLGFPTIADAGDGELVVAWHAYIPPQGNAIFARRLLTDGTLPGDEILVAESDTESLSAPRIGIDASGGFVVVWSDLEADEEAREVKGRRYDGSDQALGQEFVINSYSTGDQSLPDIAVHSTGDFVVSWNSNGGDGDLLARRYDSLGQPLGSPIQVAPPTDGHRNPRIAADDQGDFIVIWSIDDFERPDDLEIQAQRYAANGQPQGGTFVVAEPFGVYQPVDLTIDRGPAGDFVVAWTYFIFENNQQTLFTRRFDALGNALGDPFQVVENVTSSQLLPTLVLEDDNAFNITWVKSSTTLLGQRFDPQGELQGNIWPVASGFTSSFSPAAISTPQQERFVAAWVGGESAGVEIRARVFRLTPFSDGFESGDTSAWSASTASP